MFLNNICNIFLLIFLYKIFKCFLNNISQLVKILINKKLLKKIFEESKIIRVSKKFRFSRIDKLYTIAVTNSQL